MRGSQRLLQRLLQCGAVGESLRAAAGGGELAAARCLARTVAARGFAAAGQQAWRAGALRPAAGSFAAAQVSQAVAFTATAPAMPPVGCLPSILTQRMRCSLHPSLLPRSCRRADCGSLALRQAAPCAPAARRQPAPAGPRRQLRCAAHKAWPVPACSAPWAAA